MKDIIEEYMNSIINEIEEANFIATEKKINGIVINIDKNNIIGSEKSNLDFVNSTYKTVESNYKIIEDKLLESFGKDKNKLKNELKLYQIIFSSVKITAQNSPTKKNGIFFNYEFCYEPKTSKGKEFFDAISTNWFVLDTINGYKMKYGETHNI